MKGVETRRVKDLKSKRVYNVFVNARDSKVVAKEYFNNGTIKWYPFYLSDQKVTPKYQNIKYIATKNKKIPKTGFSTQDSRGYGFTNAQGVNSFFRYVDRNTPKLEAILFVDTETKLTEKGVLELSFKDFAKIRSQAKRFSESKRSEEDTLIKNVMAEIMPKTFKPAGKYIYQPGSLKRFADKYAQSPFNLSDDDTSVLKDILLGAGLSAEMVITTKRAIDTVYIEDVLKEFKDLYAYKSNSKNLEEKWHKFFKKHTWIFSQIFTYPAVFIDDKFNVGGQDLSGNTDKIVDFLYKNKLTDNVTFIEIKTHKTELLNKTPYRKPDIFSASKDVSGSIVQVLDQKNRFVKNYHSKKGASSIDTLNSGCLLIVGDLKAIRSKNKKDSFELFRSSNKDVAIVTFDELLEKITVLLNIFTKT
jgi:hypothetical protein